MFSNLELRHYGFTNRKCKAQSMWTQYALNPLSSSTRLCEPQPTVNFGSNTAFDWWSQIFEPRINGKMHIAYNLGLAGHTTRRTIPAHLASRAAVRNSLESLAAWCRRSPQIPPPPASSRPAGSPLKRCYGSKCAG